MAVTAPGTIHRGRGATGVRERPTTGSEASIRDTETPAGVNTAIGHLSDPSLPVVQGIGAGGVAGAIAMAIGLLLLRGSVTHGLLDALAPMAILLGFLLGGGLGGLGGLFLLLLGGQPHRAG